MSSGLAAIVKRKGGKTREGRGFSRKELIQAGLNLKEALKIGLPIDKRRKTVHEENIKILKEHLEKLKESKPLIQTCKINKNERKTRKRKSK